MIKKIIIKSAQKFFKFRFSDENQETFHLLVQATDNSERIWYFYFRFGIGGFTIFTTSVCSGTILYCLLTNRVLDIQFYYLEYVE